MTDTAPANPDAASEMARALNTTPVRTSLDRGWNGALALRWRHAPLHEQFAPMTEHLFITWFGTPRRIERTSGGKSVRSATLPGAVSLIPAGLEARWDIYGPLDTIHLCVPPSLLTDLAHQNDLPAPRELVDRTASADPVGSQLLSLVAGELEAPGVLDALYAEQLSMLVCVHLLRAHSPGASMSTPVFQGGLAPARLSRVLAVMEERLSEDLPLEALAEAAALSPYYFIRAFRQATGTTPHRRLMELRTERAVSLLVRTRLALAEIAAACGFGSQSHMCVWCRLLKGTTPAGVRAGG